MSHTGRKTDQRHQCSESGCQGLNNKGRRPGAGQVGPERKVICQEPTDLAPDMWVFPSSCVYLGSQFNPFVLNLDLKA